jgi:hypothetical protein
MAKKVRDEDEDFDELDESQNDNEQETDYIEEEDENDEDDDDQSGSNNFDEDDDELDIIIEIDEEDLDITESKDKKSKDTESEDTDTDTDTDITLSKHKLEGKHSLKYDSIFKGKKEDPLNEEDYTGFEGYQKDTIEVDKSSSYYFESVDNEKYIRSKLVKEKVYNVLTENTGINFLNNRRKPSRSDFNQYYNLLRDNLKNESFTNIELFNELAVYFSDNLFNMFKLLDKKWRNLIISELQDHIGKNSNSKEVTNRNIYEGTEIEFEWIDEFNKEVIIITGVVMEVDYDNSIFKVDSYENIYNVKIELITKILNNTKFKYNLNRLNNIDFL